MRSKVKTEGIIPKFCSLLLLNILAITLHSCDNMETNPSLPQFHIWVDSLDLNFGDYILGDITYYDSDKSIQFEKSPAYIKYRGNSSAHYEKKCFSLKFLDTKCFDNMECHKKWKFNAEYIDKTFMRNKLSYDLFRLFSPGNFAPRINYAILYLNNNYRGIYTLTERVDEDRLNLFNGDKNAVLFKEPPISYPPEEHNKRHEDFIKYSYWAEFYKDFSDKALEKLIMEVYYNQRFPDIDEIEKKYLIHQITEFIFNSSDRDFIDEANFNVFFSINNIIDWHLLLLITNNEDGVVKNFYFYRQGVNEPYKFCPWDYDHSFGRDGDGEPNLDSFIDIARMRLLVRLLETNAFNYKQKLYDKFTLLKKNNILTTKNINRMIDENVMEIEPFIVQNETRWPPDYIPYFNGSSFQNEVLILRSWIESRLENVENYLITLNNE